MKNGKEMRYFSMFTGVGGFELGIENASDSTNHKGRTSQHSRRPFRCTGFSEIDKYASELLKDKWPNIKNYGDATKIIPEELPDFELLVGGFPCQAFSIAGKRKGMEDTRGTLFYEIARIVKIKRPKYLLLENVKGLLSHDGGRTFATILTTFSELGYTIQWMVLNSKFFGVPQNRERVFIIGSAREARLPEILPFRQSNKDSFPGNQEGQNTVASTITGGNSKHSGRGTHLKQIISGSQGNRVYSTDGSSTTIASQAGGRGAKTGLYAVLTPDRGSKRQNGRRFKENGEPSFTITKQDIHGISDGMRIRRLTPLECERLQGFPDGWTKGFSDTQRYKMMGNAVTVNVVAAIMRKLI